jgi:hypothetical protein
MISATIDGCLENDLLLVFSGQGQLTRRGNSIGESTRCQGVNALANYDLTRGKGGQRSSILCDIRFDTLNK